MRKTRQELVNDLPEYIKSLGIVSPDKTTGESLRIMLKNILDSMTTARETVPKGTIVAWHGDVNNIPEGWHLCDEERIVQAWYGPFFVPDLSGKFIVGYDPSDTDYNTIGKEGGDKTVTLTEAQMPRHKHDIFDYDSDRNKAKDANNYYIHGHGKFHFGEPGLGLMQGINTTQQTGGSQPHENRPPYYTLAYIIYEGRPELDYEDGAPDRARVTATAYEDRIEASWVIDDLSYVREVRCYLDGVLVARKAPEDTTFILNQTSVSARVYNFHVETLNSYGMSVRSEVATAVWYAPLSPMNILISFNGWAIRDDTYSVGINISLIDNFGNFADRSSISNINWSELKVYQNSLDNVIETRTFRFRDTWTIINVSGLVVGNTYYFKAINHGFEDNYKESNIDSYIQYTGPTTTTRPYIPPGGGGGGSVIDPTCPIEGSVVEMFDGTFKNIEDIKIGDEVLTVAIKRYKDNNTTEILKWGSSSLDYEYAKTIVESNEPHEVENTIRINDVIETSDSHIHLIKRDNIWKFVRSTEVKVSDLMRTKVGDITVSSIENLNNKKTVYAIRLTKGSNTLFVDGILTHNNLVEKLEIN